MRGLIWRYNAVNLKDIGSTMNNFHGTDSDSIGNFKEIVHGTNLESIGNSREKGHDANEECIGDSIFWRSTRLRQPDLYFGIFDVFERILQSCHV